MQFLQSTIMTRMFRILSLAGMLASAACIGQVDNELLDREFWKTQPTLQEVRERVEAGHDATALDQYNFDAMSWALIEEATPDVLEYLLEFEGNGVNKLTHDERNYVFWAAYKDNLSFMKELERRGARFDIVDEHGYSLLNFSAVTGQTNLELYDYIISKGADPAEERNRTGAHALLLVAPFMTDFGLSDYFEPYGLSLSDLDADGNNGWLYASKGGHLDVLTQLLEQGMDAKFTNAANENAAHFAVRGTRGGSNGREVLEFLASQGVDVHAANKEGVTPMMLAAHGRAERDALVYLTETAPNIHLQDLEGQSAMHHALAYGNLEACELLRDEGWSMEEAPYRGVTLLQALADGYRARDHETFEKLSVFLRDNRVPLAQVLEGGEQWLHLGARVQSMSMLKFGLVLGLDVNRRDDDGMTPLHEACLTATNEEIINWLVAVGADIEATTDFGETPKDLAMENEALVDALPESLIVR